MAMNLECSSKDDYKTHFSTREGLYHLMPVIDYYRPNRSNFASGPLPLNIVRLSVVSIPGITDNGDRLCLNIGKELYVYVYKGVKSGADLVTPVDKKIYKMINPTCHNFNSFCASIESVPLIVGFSSGIIHLIDIIRKDVNKVFNEEKLVDKTKVTCIQWIPNSRHFFLTSHASGQLYLYNEELPCTTSPPNYQLFKHGDGYAIHVCKTKSTRNPLYRWVIGSEGCSINEFAFSPCNLYLAVVSQDGFLRVFHYDTMELVGFARSYFGGFLCVCWSPDSKYIAVGGEDDLVTIWSFHQKQIVARGQGHHSWVNVVAFDPWTSSYNFSEDAQENSRFTTCYRLGSIGQDTQLCLWDVTEDVLRQQTTIFNTLCTNKTRNSTCTGNGEACVIGNSHSTSRNFAFSNNSVNHNNNSSSTSNNNNNTIINKDNQLDGVTFQPRHSPPSLSQRLGLLNFGDRKDNSLNSNNKHSKHPIRSSTSDKSTNSSLKYNENEDPMKLIGTAACPRFDQCPLLEPLVCKKISHERLSSLIFKEDCILTSCYDGSVSTWARPGKITHSNAHLVATSTMVSTNLSTESTSTVV